MRRGFTIPELLTVMFLSGIVLLLIAQIMLPSTFLFKTEQGSSDVHQSALVLMRRLTQELLNTTLESVTILQAPTGDIGAAVCYAPVRGFGPSGAMLFESRMVFFYHHIPTGRVIKGTWLPGAAPLAGTPYSLTGAEPPQLSQTELQRLCDADSTTSVRGRVAARYVKELTLTDADGDTRQLQLPLRMRVHTQLQVEHRGRSPKMVNVFLEERVVPRNVRW
ncbi:MAG: prepilin-type N-terminal cleavage/methylation domain-containing protein [Candidatus Eremiobacterota bacterium]